MANQHLMTSNSALAAVALTSTLFGLISIGEAGRRTVRDLRGHGAAGRDRAVDVLATRHAGGSAKVDFLAA